MIVVLPTKLFFAVIQEMIPGILPVMVFGSEAMGWVHRGLCQSFDVAVVSAKYQEALMKKECSREDTLFRRVIKQALQYTGSMSTHSVNCVQPIGIGLVGNNLIALENDLPAEVLGSQSFSMWHQWRKRVRSAESAAGLASEVSCLELFSLWNKVLYD